MEKLLVFTGIILGLVILINGQHINTQGVYRTTKVESSLKGKSIDAQKIARIQFLVAVNDTWGSCITTVRTPMIKPNVPANESDRIPVGKCDSGPLTYTVKQTKDGNTTVALTFYSSVIEDASHPTCNIVFSGGFLPPTTLGYKDGGLPSVLPGCSTMDSREGYHMTYYWFYIYDIFFN